MIHNMKTINNLQSLGYTDRIDEVSGIIPYDNKLAFEYGPYELEQSRQGRVYGRKGSFSAAL